MTWSAPRDPGSQPVRTDAFVLWIAAFCALLAFGGFVPTYFAPLAAGSPIDVAPVVHLHGILFFGWVSLLVVQSLLVARRRTSTHRSLGLLGISLATAMVIVGGIVSLRANAERMTNGAVDLAYALGFSNTVALLAFGAMFGLAVGYRRRPATHKRLMLFATAMLLNAPVGRLYRPLFAPAQPPPWIVFVTVDSILVALVIHDWRTLRRIHPVTLSAGAVLVGAQILRFPLPAMDWWRSTYDVMLRLVA